MEAKAETRAISAPVDPDVLADRLALAREKKQEKAQERARIASEDQTRMREGIARRLPNMSALWNRAFARALETGKDEDWRRADNLMTGYVNAKRSLAKEG